MPTFTSAQEGETAAAPARLSLSIERAVSLARTSIDPDNGNDPLVLRGFNVGGPLRDPLHMPRLGVDVQLAGWTLGTGFAYNRLTAEIDEEELSGRVLLLTPRVGYRVAVTPSLDLIPRGGISWLRGSLSDDASGEVEGNVRLVSLEVVGVWDLGGLEILCAGSYDTVLTATGSLSDGAGSDSENDYEGMTSSLGLWVGLGGTLDL